MAIPLRIRGVGDDPGPFSFVEWLVKRGEYVKPATPIAVIESALERYEVTAGTGGKINSLNAEVGDENLEKSNVIASVVPRGFSLHNGKKKFSKVKN